MIPISPSVRPIFFDLEMNRDPEESEITPSITQLAAYDPTRSGEASRFTAFLEPEPFYRTNSSYPKSDNESPLPITRRKFAQVWPDFRRWCLHKRSPDTRIVLIAHNAWKCDKVLLDVETARIGDAIPRDWKVFDTLAMAKFVSPCKKKGLQALREYYKIEPNRAHVAADDVTILYKVFSALVGSADHAKIYEAMLDPHPILLIANMLKANRALFPQQISEKVERIYYDTETTGLFSKDPRDPAPRVVELSAYAPSRNGEYARFSKLVFPEMLIPEAASNANHITDAMVKGKPVYKEIWPQFKAWCRAGADPDATIVLIAHNNYNYDKKVLDAECDRIGKKVPKDWRFFDTFFLSKCVHKGPVFKGFSHRLQNLAQYYNVVPEIAHRAMADVDTMYLVMEKMLGNAPRDKVFKAMLTAHPIKAVALIAEETRILEKSRLPNPIINQPILVLEKRKVPDELEIQPVTVKIEKNEKPEAKKVELKQPEPKKVEVKKVEEKKIEPKKFVIQDKIERKNDSDSEPEVRIFHKRLKKGNEMKGIELKSSKSDELLVDLDD